MCLWLCNKMSINWVGKFQSEFWWSCFSNNFKKIGLFFHWGEKTKDLGKSLVVQVSAWLLDWDILVISEGSKENNPCLLIPDDKEHTFPSIILGNAAGCHYQSYIPLENVALDQSFKSPNISSSPEITKYPLQNQMKAIIILMC